MAFPISPGVFVQDQRRPPEWQSKGAMLFLGPFPKGPVGFPVLVKSAAQLEELFGEFVPGASPSHVTLTALRAFFEQGGAAGAGASVDGRQFLSRCGRSADGDDIRR